MGRLWFGNFPEDDLNWARLIDQARQRAAAAAELWTQSQIAHAAQIGQQAPWLPPGAVLSLAKNEASPQAIQNVARLGAIRHAQRPNLMPGSTITGAELVPGHPDRVNPKGRVSANQAENWGQPQVRQRALPSPNQIENWGSGRPLGFSGRLLRDARRRAEGRVMNRAADKAIDAEMERLRGVGILDEDGLLRVPVNASVLASAERPNYIDLNNVGALRPDALAQVQELVDLLDRLPADQVTNFITADNAVVTYNPETRRITTDYDMGSVNPFLPDSLRDWFKGLHLPRLGDIPGLRDTSIGNLSQENLSPTDEIDQFISDRHLPTLNDIPGIRGSEFGGAVERAGPFGGGVPIRQTIQEAGIVLNAPIQEATGQLRNVYSLLNGQNPDWTESQSDFGIMLGTSMDPGSGLGVDPDSEVWQERLNREAERGMIDGHRVSLGRLSALPFTSAGLIDPDTTPYRVLTGVVDILPQVFDPFATGAAGVSKGVAARNLFVQGSEEIAQAAAKDLVSTSTLRSLASRFEVRGRAGMDRQGLLDALQIRNPARWDNAQVRSVATALNISGRSRMNVDDLRTAVSEQWTNLGGRTTPTPSVGAAEGPTSLPVAVGAGLANVSRITGLPQLFSRATRNRAGLIRGDFTNGVHGPTTEAWFASTPGATRVQQIADETNVLHLDQATRHRLHLSELRALRDADTPEAVRDVLRPLLVSRFRSADDVWNPGLIDWPGLPGNPNIRNRRWLTDVPGSFIDLDDPRSAIDEGVAWLRNAHVSEEIQQGYLDKLVETNNNSEVADVVEEMIASTDGVLAAAGVRSPQVRAELSTAWRNEMQEAQNFFVAQATEQQSFDGITVSGKAHSTGGPYEWHGAYNRFLYLPDYRRVRRLTTEVPGWKALATDDSGELAWLGTKALNFQEELWKPVTLLRGAWPIRVIGEEQLRMAAAGYAGMFNHPLSHIAYVIARHDDLTGDPYRLSQAFTEAEVQGRSGWLTERVNMVRTGQQVAYKKGDRGYAEAYAETLMDMHQDPVQRHLATHGDIDQTMAWLQDGAGREVYEKMIRDHGEMFLRGETSLREYLESAVRWNDIYSGGNDELLGVIRDGRLGRRAAFNNTTMHPMPALTRALNRTFFDAGPGEVLGVKNVADLPRYQGKVVDRMFNLLMGTPTNALSRSPLFRQAYQKRMEEVVSFLTPQAKEELLRNAQATEARFGFLKIKQMPKAQIERIKAIKANGRLDLADADAFSKEFALRETKNLLYDLNKRSQIMDAMRLVMPFGEAWREVATRWLKLLNPASANGWKNIRRIQQVIAGARGEEFGELTGAPPGQGFFWDMPVGEDTEQVFVYPGSQWATGTITNIFGPKVPVPLIGRVEGLSMITEVLPGIGPVAAVPVAMFMPDKPGITGKIRDLVLPYGSPTDEQGLSAVTQMLNYAPPWMRRGFQALTGHGYDQETNRLWANTVMYTANYLYSTGKYDTSTEEGQQQLIKDATEQARILYGVRALASFGAPSAPAPDWLTNTDEGLVRTAFLRDEYHRLQDTEGFEVADEMFLDRFGWMAGMAMQAHTYTVKGGVEPTDEFGIYAESSEGKALRNSYEATWGFFGPDGGRYSYRTYAENIQRGDVATLTPEQWLNLGQNHLGQMILDEVLLGLGPEEDWDDDDRAFKREIESDIRSVYPGFRDFEGLPQRAEREDVLRELARAVKDDRVLRTEAGQGLDIYWEARNKVIGWAADDGFTVDESEPFTYDLSRANSLSADRTWLWEFGQEIAEAYPDFGRLWDFQLKYEVQPPEEER